MLLFPKRVLFCGGGIRNIAQIGVLQSLEDGGYLKCVTEWSGVSAGGFLAMCLAIGYTITEMTDICLRFDFTSIMDVDIAPGWLLNMGLDKGNNVTRLLEACMRVKGIDTALTFSDCKQQFGKSIRLFATDLCSGKMKIFSSDKTPDYIIIDAVKGCMTVPLYFQIAVQDDKCILLDGAVISNYPMMFLTMEERCETLGILLLDNDISISSNDIGLKTLLLRPVDLMLHSRSECEALINRNNTIVVSIPGIKVLDWNIDNTMKNSLIQSGRDAVKEYIKSFPKPVRRFSVS